MLPSSIKQQHIIFRPLRKIPLSQRRILLDVLLALPHSIFRDFSYHQKSFSGNSTKNLQFQEESAEVSTRANLQPSRTSCSSWLQITQSKLPIKIPTLRRKFAKLREKNIRFDCKISHFCKISYEIVGMNKISPNLFPPFSY